MDLPTSQQRQKYIDDVKAIEAEIKKATEGDEVSDVELHVAQEKLDTLADAYQDDETIGSARYKLYELQALIHYYDQKHDDALAFINQAIETKGGSYPKAEKLKEKLSSTTTPEKKPAVVADESKMTKEEKRKKLIGLEGWLALFIVGSILGLLVTIVRFFTDGFMSASDSEILNQYQAGLGDSLSALSTFENLAVILYVGLIITSLVLLFRRRKIAKGFAIATLLFGALYGLIDYSIASSIFESSDIFQTAEVESTMSKYRGDIARGVLAVFIWVPYFLVSKRVKATLTK